MIGAGAALRAVRPDDAGTLVRCQQGDVVGLLPGIPERSLVVQWHDGLGLQAAGHYLSSLASAHRQSRALCFSVGQAQAGTLLCSSLVAPSPRGASRARPILAERTAPAGRVASERAFLATDAGGDDALSRSCPQERRTLSAGSYAPEVRAMSRYFRKPVHQ